MKLIQLKQKHSIFLLCTSILLFCSSVQAKSELNWLQIDWSPHQIADGPFQGQGTFDLLQQYISNATPQFRHQSRLVSLPRLGQIFLRQQGATCTTGTLYSEERAKNRLFSKQPMAVGPALAVGYIAGKLDTHPAMQADGVDISQLAQDKTLTGVYQPNRFYPQVVAETLALTNTNLSKYSLTSEVNAVALLTSGRVDYIIEYPERLQYYKQLLAKDTPLQHRPIVGANVASVSYVSCSKDAVGQAAIEAINLILPALWQQPEYIEAMQRWLDASARQRLSADISQLKQQALMQLKPRPNNAVNAGND